MSTGLRVIGLTGGIASGKSTVSQMFRELGATVVDADSLARAVVEPGSPGLEEVAARFPEVIDSFGRLDRTKLAEHVFTHPTERLALNALLHPRIRQAFLDRKAELSRSGVELMLYDAPLLIENNLHREMDGVILVTSPPELQVARLCARSGLTEEQAKARLAAQLPLSAKLPHATWIVDNTGDLASTRAQVDQIWKLLTHSSP